VNPEDPQPVAEAGDAPAPKPKGPRHLAPDDAADRPLIDLSRDPTPGVPDHAAPDDEE
jgi:hypothetical protein